jgi:hypothetical protein
MTHVPYGGLTDPSPELQSAVNKLNKMFKTINKNSLKFKKNIVKRYFRRFQNVVTIPEDILTAFIKQRIFL